MQWSMRSTHTGTRSSEVCAAPRKDSAMTYHRPSHLGTRAGLRWAASLTLLFFVASAHPAQGAGVVGSGTPESCIETALDAALAGGGLVTFDCGQDPVT